jgi:hypothetical protein
MYLNQDGNSGAAEYQFRGAERVAILLDGVLTKAGADGIDVRLRDVSNLGFMAECSGFVGIGSAVMLHIPGLDPLPAEVRWGLSGWIGCKFEQELSWDRLFLLLVEEGRKSSAR